MLFVRVSKRLDDMLNGMSLCYEGLPLFSIVCRMVWPFRICQCVPETQAVTRRIVDTFLARMRRNALYSVGAYDCLTVLHCCAVVQ